MKSLPVQCVQLILMLCRYSLLCAILLLGFSTFGLGDVAYASETGKDTVAMPASLPLQRDAEAALESGRISGVMVVGIILLAALLFYVRTLQRRKRRMAATGKPANRRGQAPPMIFSWFNWLRWNAGGEEPDELRVISSKVLSQASRLHVVEWNGNRYLLAHSDQHCTLLDKLPKCHDGSLESEASASSGDEGVQS